MVPLFRIHVSYLFCLNLKPLHFGAFYTLVLAHPSASLVCQYFLFIRIQVNNSPCGETNSLVTLLVACRTMYLLPSEKGLSWRDRGDRHFGCWTQAHNHQLVPLQNYLKPSKYWSWSVHILLSFAHIFVLYLLWFVPAHNIFLSLSFHRKKLLVVICATHTKQICPCSLFIVICASTHRIFVFVLL